MKLKDAGRRSEAEAGLDRFLLLTYHLSLKLSNKRAGVDLDTLKCKVTTSERY